MRKALALVVALLIGSAACLVPVRGALAQTARHTTARPGAKYHRAAIRKGRLARPQAVHTRQAGRAVSGPPQVTDTLTFSEFPSGTSITGQYRTAGVLFGGDAPFITSDGSNPTSPVLSGSPLFQGRIAATFVNRDGTPRTVDSVSLDVGYIDSPGSVEVVSVDGNGAPLDTTTINNTGIVNVTIAKPGIAAFSVQAVGAEPAGFAIDNLTFSGYELEKGATVGEQGGAANPSQEHGPCLTARPVNCATGEFFHQFTDFTVPGRGVPLGFERTYLSALAGTDGPLGHGWTFGYGMSLTVDGQGAVLIRQENGSTVTFDPDGNGGYTPPARVYATLTKNADGTWTFTRLTDHVDRLFDAQGRLTRLTDRNGYVTDLTYDGSHLTTVTDPAGRTLALTYGGDRITQVTGPLGRQQSFDYSGAGDLTKATDPLGRSWTFGYDGGHRMTTMTDPRGGTTANTYDDQDRVVAQTDPAGLKTSWSYQGNPAADTGSTTTMTDPHGVVTGYAFSDLLLTSVTHAMGTPLEQTTGYAYDPLTQSRTEVVSPSGALSQFSYDARGDLLSATDPQGLTTLYGVNDFGEVTSVTSPSGRTTTMTYDGHGNLTGVTDPLGAQTANAYADAAHPGDLTSVTDPDGRVRDYTYDGPGNVASTTVHPAAGVNLRTTFGYDAAGDRVCQVPATADAAGVSCPATARTITTAYDASGQLVGATDPAGRKTTYGYDGNGDQIKVVDPAGNTAVTSFDADDRTTKVVTGGGSLSTTASAYDIAGGTAPCTGIAGAVWCDSRTDPNGHATTLFYDALGQLTAEVRPGGRVVRHAYDLDGRETTRTDPAGRTTSLGYDLSGRLTSIGYSDPGTPAVSYQYDSDGLRTQMTDGSGATTYSYDAAGRLVSRSAGPVGYGYDGSGDITAITYPNGRQVLRAFDAAGRLSSVKDWSGQVTAFGYDPQGKPTSVKYPNGTTVRSAYDDSGLLTATSVSADSAPNTPLAGFSYTRDTNGMVSQEQGGGATQTYSYDGRRQLSGVSGSSYGYDAGGRPTILATVTQTFDTLDQLTSAGPVSYGYDAVGDRTSAGPVHYGYDQAGRLTGVTAPPTAAPVVTQVSPAAGPTGGGATVTISGLNLTGTTKVMFGSKAGSAMHVVSGVAVTAKAPAGSGTVDVTVQTAKGTSATGPADLYAYVQTPVVTRISPRTGKSGATVTISGYNLTGTSTVLFGTKAATKVHVVSSTTVTVSAPAGSGTVDVTARTAKGISARTSDDRFSYDALPVVGGLSPNAGGASGGTVVTISGWNLTGTTKVMFGSKAGSAVHVVSGVAVTAKAPAGSGTVDVTVQTAKGTSAKSLADHFAYVSGTAGGYAYDGDGLRVAKTVGGTVTKFAWDVTGRAPVLLSDGSTSYVYGPDGLPIEQIAADGTPAYFFHDAVGSTRALLTAAGGVAATFRFDAYGRTAAGTGTARTPLLFAGGYQDAETGLYYLVKRYYDPATAQFLTVDPALDLTLTPYTYAGDNPVNAADTDGRIGFLLGGAIGGITGAVVGGVGWALHHENEHDSFWAAVGSGAVGGAVTGGCLVASFGLASVTCGALGGVATAASGDWFNDKPVTGGDVITGGLLGAAGGTLKFFPMGGREPYKLFNVLNPGVNAQRFYLDQFAVGSTMKPYEWLTAWIRKIFANC